MNKTIRSIHSQIGPDKEVKAALIDQIRHGRQSEFRSHSRQLLVTASVAVMMLIAGIAGVLTLSGRMQTAETISAADEIGDFNLKLLGYREEPQSLYKTPDEDVEQEIWINNPEIKFIGMKYKKDQSESIAELVSSKGITDDNVIGQGTVQAFGISYRVLVTSITDHSKNEMVALWLSTDSFRVYTNPDYDAEALEQVKIRLRPVKFDDSVEFPRDDHEYETIMNIISNNYEIEYEGETYQVKLGVDGQPDHDNIIGWGSSDIGDKRYNIVVTTLTPYDLPESYTKEDYIALFFSDTFWIPYQKKKLEDIKGVPIEQIYVEAETTVEENDIFNTDPNYFDDTAFSKEQIVEHLTDTLGVSFVRIDGTLVNYLFDCETDKEVSGKPYAAGLLYIYVPDNVTDVGICVPVRIYKDMTDDTMIMLMQDGTKLLLYSSGFFDTDPYIKRGSFIHGKLNDNNGYTSYPTRHIGFWYRNPSLSDFMDDLYKKLPEYRTDAPLLERGYVFNYNDIIFGVADCRLDLSAFKDGEMKGIYEKEGDFANFTVYGKNYRIPDEAANYICRIMYSSECEYELMMNKNSREDESVTVVLSNGYKIGGLDVVKGMDLNTNEAYRTWVSKIMSSDDKLAATLSTEDCPDFTRGTRTILLRNNGKGWLTAKLAVDEKDIAEITLSSRKDGVKKYNLIVNTGNDVKLYKVGKEEIAELQSLIEGHSKYIEILKKETEGLEY